MIGVDGSGNHAPVEHPEGPFRVTGVRVTSGIVSFICCSKRFISLLKRLLYGSLVLFSLFSFSRFNIHYPFTKEKCKSINRAKHRVIQCAHPSPLSATKTNAPFIGSKSFSRTNAALVELGKEPIDWRL